MRRRFPVRVATLVVLLTGCASALVAVQGQPASTRWKRTPTPDEIARCQPLVADIPDGSAILRCRVGEAGELEGCVVRSTTNVKLGEWGLCMSARFVADDAYIGQEVELPLQWRRPT